jgi:gamma-glutamylcyclotransferase (GGCT)/AIG2-like uncharacterized protein YtfP
MKLKLFVYGTLKRGESNDISDVALFLKPMRTASQFQLLDFEEYPGMTYGNSSVEGDLFEVSLRELWKIDDFEDCPKLFLRRTILLEDESLAEAYLISPQHIAKATCKLEKW